MAEQGMFDMSGLFGTGGLPSDNVTVQTDTTPQISKEEVAAKTSQLVNTVVADKAAKTTILSGLAPEQQKQAVATTAEEIKEGVKSPGFFDGIKSTLTSPEFLSIIGGAIGGGIAGQSAGLQGGFGAGATYGGAIGVEQGEKRRKAKADELFKIKQLEAKQQEKPFADQLAEAITLTQAKADIAEKTKETTQQRKDLKEAKDVAVEAGLIGERLNDLNSVLDKIPSGRIGGSFARLKELTQTDKQLAANVGEADGIKATLLSNIARNLGGERGVLTDQDIARIEKGFPALVDTKEQRDRKFKVINKLISDRIAAFAQKAGVSPDDITFTSKNETVNNALPPKKGTQQIGRFSVRVKK